MAKEPAAPDGALRWQLSDAGPQPGSSAIGEVARSGARWMAVRRACVCPQGRVLVQSLPVARAMNAGSSRAEREHGPVTL